MVEDTFRFYPHRCTIFRGEQINPITGVATPIAFVRNLPCYVQQGYSQLLGEKMQGTDSVQIGDTNLVIMPGDTIDITLENGQHYIAKIKQAYPIEDEDFGGQELKLYDRDATN